MGNKLKRTIIGALYKLVFGGLWYKTNRVN